MSQVHYHDVITQVKYIFPSSKRTWDIWLIIKSLKLLEKKYFPEELDPCYQNTFLLFEIFALSKNIQNLIWENLTPIDVNSSETGTLPYTRINSISLLVYHEIRQNNAK